MNDPIEILMNQHKEVLEVLEKIGASIDELKDSPAETKQKLIALIEKLDKDFDVHSLRNEEEGLFPVMETFLPRDQGPIGVMIMEHEEFLKQIKDFKQQLGNEDYDKVLQIGQHITTAIREHIYKEDNILYNIARMHLSSEDMQKVYDKLMQIAKEYK